jgi:BASS family bile acid:Na+ symporter
LLLVFVVVSGSAESFSIVGHGSNLKGQQQQQRQQRQQQQQHKNRHRKGHRRQHKHKLKQGIQACTSRLFGEEYDVSKKDVVFNRNTNSIELGRTRKRTRIALSSALSLSVSSNANANVNSNDDDDNGCKYNYENDNGRQSSSALEKRLSMFTLLTPLWTILAAGFAVWNASWCSKVVGSLSVMQTAYAILMFAMGLSITPKDLTRALWRQPKLLSINALLCFGVMPLLAAGIAKIGLCGSSSGGAAIGLILLGSVSGGQASNLFTLLAGGDVALSVICTISTTLLGVLATPFLVQLLLGCSVAVDGRGVLKSIVSLVLVPLFAGSAISRNFQEAPTPTQLKPHKSDDASSNFFTQKVSRFLPTIGVLSTLVLVAGGSSNSIVSLSTTTTAAATTASAGNTSLALTLALVSILLPSCLLSALGGAMALWIANRKALALGERTKRTLVIETLSKSPTLAYILALKHFGSDVSVAMIPGAAMVTLAVIGALVASIWGYYDNEMRSRT